MKKLSEIFEEMREATAKAEAEEPKAEKVRDPLGGATHHFTRNGEACGLCLELVQNRWQLHPGDSWLCQKCALSERKRARRR